MPKAYELPLPGAPFDPEIWYLGRMCKRSHDCGNGKTLRLRKNKSCIICTRIDALDRQAKRRTADIETFNAQAAAYRASRRALHGRESRSKHGLPYAPSGDIQTRKLRAAIKRAGRLPSVAKLVYLEQRRYWKENPQAERTYRSKWNGVQWRWKYMTDPEFNSHERQRNSEKKARNRQNHTVRLRRDALRQQFAAFDSNCCYCGSADRIVVDHFIPRSKGGPHVLTNLVPACHRCNTSKRDHDPTEWYQSQSFYSLKRWRLIMKVLKKNKSTINQLPLL